MEYIDLGQNPAFRFPLVHRGEIPSPNFTHQVLLWAVGLCMACHPNQQRRKTSQVSAQRIRLRWQCEQHSIHLKTENTMKCLRKKTTRYFSLRELGPGLLSVLGPWQYLTAYRADAYDATPMLGPHMTLSPYYPVLPLRDPHAFNLADLSGRSGFVASHLQQLPSPQRELPGVNASPFANAANPLPPMLGYQDSPSLTRPYLPLISSPPRQMPPTLPSSPYFVPGPIAPPVQVPLSTNYGIYSNGPLTPLRHSQRLSIGPNTTTNGVTADLSPTTPPRTGQDLLMRVLGGVPSAGANGTPTRRARQSTSPPRGRNASPESRPPLLFGAANGNSIWAP